MKKLIVCILFCFASTTYASQTLYVQSVKAKILNEPKFSAKVIALAKRGDALSATAQKDGWYQVLYAKEVGFIPALLVANHPPTVIRSITAKSNIGSRARRRASAVATAGATRGLTADDRKRTSQSDVDDYSALAFMEKAGVTENEAAEFLHIGMGK